MIKGEKLCGAWMEFQWSPGGHFLVKQGIYQENVSGDIPLAYPLT